MLRSVNSLCSFESELPYAESNNWRRKRLCHPMASQMRRVPTKLRNYVYVYNCGRASLRRCDLADGDMPPWVSHVSLLLRTPAVDPVIAPRPLLDGTLPISSLRQRPPPSCVHHTNALTAQRLQGSRPFGHDLRIALRAKVHNPKCSLITAVWEMSLARMTIHTLSL